MSRTPGRSSARKQKTGRSSALTTTSGAASSLPPSRMVIDEARCSMITGLVDNIDSIVEAARVNACLQLEDMGQASLEAATTASDLQATYSGSGTATGQYDPSALTRAFVRQTLPQRTSTLYRQGTGLKPLWTIVCDQNSTFSDRRTALEGMRELVALMYFGGDFPDPTQNLIDNRGVDGILPSLQSDLTAIAKDNNIALVYGTRR